MRRYQNVRFDSALWDRFTFRGGDVVISTPPKCGTTWMQSIVGMLLLNGVDCGPVNTISPWLDAVWLDAVRSNDIFATLEAQTHRRFVKTHTPLDGLPQHDNVTYITLIRHPLDTALSYKDHRSNQNPERPQEIGSAALDGASEDSPAQPPPPDDPGDFLRWFIDSDDSVGGSVGIGLTQYCQTARTYWDARNARNVHLFHYTDMWNDLPAEMRQVARALGVNISDARLTEFVEAASIDSMRSRSAGTTPEAHLGVWVSPEKFFKIGGTRDWQSLLSPDDLTHFDDRLTALASDAASWIRVGRASLS